MSEIEAKSITTCRGVFNEGTFRCTGGEAVGNMDRESFTEEEEGDGVGARVPKQDGW